MSRYRLVAAAIIPILVLSACNSSASPSPSTSTPITLASEPSCVFANKMRFADSEGSSIGKATLMR